MESGWSPLCLNCIIAGQGTRPAESWRKPLFDWIDASWGASKAARFRQVEQGWTVSSVFNASSSYKCYFCWYIWQFVIPRLQTCFDFTYLKNCCLSQVEYVYLSNIFLCFRLLAPQRLPSETCLLLLLVTLLILTQCNLHLKTREGHCQQLWSRFAMEALSESICFQSFSLSRFSWLESR